MATTIRVGLVLIVLAVLTGSAYYVTRVVVGNDVGGRTRQVTEGEVLENVGLVAFVNEDRGRVIPLHEVFGSGCGIMVFFDSRCSYCEQMAGKWSNVTSIATSVRQLPVAWTAVSLADTGAAGFIRRHRLTQPWYAVQTDDDRRSLGIGGWPTLYLLSPGGRFEGEVTSRDPESLDLPVTRCFELNSQNTAPTGR